jgi:hypothetical protein
MNIIPADTSIEAAVKQIEVLRRMDISARAAMTFQLSDNLRQIVEDGVRLRLGDCDEQKIRQEVIRLMIGDALFKQIYPDIGA